MPLIRDPAMAISSAAKCTRRHTDTALAVRIPSVRCEPARKGAVVSLSGGDNRNSGRRHPPPLPTTVAATTQGGDTAPCYIPPTVTTTPHCVDTNADIRIQPFFVRVPRLQAPLATTVTGKTDELLRAEMDYRMDRERRSLSPKGLILPPK